MCIVLKQIYKHKCLDPPNPPAHFLPPLPPKKNWDGQSIDTPLKSFSFKKKCK